jgi:hypothetical protein
MRCHRRGRPPPGRPAPGRRSLPAAPPASAACPAPGRSLPTVHRTEWSSAGRCPRTTGGRPATGCGGASPARPADPGWPRRSPPMGGSGPAGCRRARCPRSCAARLPPDQGGRTDRTASAPPSGTAPDAWSWRAALPVRQPEHTCPAPFPRGGPARPDPGAAGRRPTRCPASTTPGARRCAGSAPSPHTPALPGAGEQLLHTRHRTRRRCGSSRPRRPARGRATRGRARARCPGHALDTWTRR